MIVIAIMGILSAIATRNFRRYLAERGLNGEASMAMSDLMVARRKAVTKNNDFSVTFRENHQYAVLGDNNKGSTDSGETT
jgi:Tfp pilus assembly protein FimT